MPDGLMFRETVIGWPAWAALIGLGVALIGVVLGVSLYASVTGARRRRRLRARSDRGLSRQARADAAAAALAIEADGGHPPAPEATGGNGSSRPPGPVGIGLPRLPGPVVVRVEAETLEVHAPRPMPTLPPGSVARPESPVLARTPGGARHSGHSTTSEPIARPPAPEPVPVPGPGPGPGGPSASSNRPSASAAGGDAVPPAHPRHRYRVFGVREATGENVQLLVAAIRPEDVHTLARKQGVLPTGLVRVD